jgi:hypothetical protein
MGEMEHQTFIEYLLYSRKHLQETKSHLLFRLRVECIRPEAASYMCWLKLSLLYAKNYKTDKTESWRRKRNKNKYNRR